MVAFVAQNVEPTDISSSPFRIFNGRGNAPK